MCEGYILQQNVRMLCVLMSRLWVTMRKSEALGLYLLGLSGALKGNVGLRTPLRGSESHSKGMVYIFRS